MNKTFDVVGKKKYFYIFSIAVIAVAIILTFVMGMNIAIEFKGGTIITYSYNGTIDETKVAVYRYRRCKSALQCSFRRKPCRRYENGISLLPVV